MTDLQNYHLQIQRIKLDAQNLLAGLSDDEFTWRPDNRRWSIAQCIDHLLVTGADSLSNVGNAIHAARLRGAFSDGPFRYGVIERWFVRQMDANSSMRFRAPKAYLPAAGGRCHEMAEQFEALQNRFLQMIEDANGIDLARVKVSNPISQWFKLSLGQEFAFNAAHERRHLWQARQLLL